MTNLLVITSSPNGDYSKSTKLVTDFSNTLTSQIPNLTVTVRDLAKTDVPHLNPTTLSGFFSNPAEHSDAQKNALELSDQLIAELEAADIVVIGAAMHNYTITSGLKAYIDQIARAGKTFNYGAEGPVGELTGKKVYVVKTSGGDYSQAPMKDMDFLQPYLTFVLGFVGMKDVSFINYGGAAMGEEMAATADKKAATDIDNAVTALISSLNKDKTAA